MESQPSLKFLLPFKGQMIVQPFLSVKECQALMMSAISFIPSVTAAGPGCKITGDLISNTKLSFTALILSQFSLATSFSFLNFFPHQDAMIISGLRSMTSYLFAMILSFAKEAFCFSL